jgi:hypothetical protein
MLLVKKVENVEIKESPTFIKNRLIASGIRPINNVVDISKEKSGLKNVIHSHENPLEVTIGLLLGCEFFIGLASGI